MAQIQSVGKRHSLLQLKGIADTLNLKVRTDKGVVGSLQKGVQNGIILAQLVKTIFPKYTCKAEIHRRV